MKRLIFGLFLLLILLLPHAALAGGDKAQKAENQRQAKERHELSSLMASCFPAGTQITLADGSTKNIEDVKIKDKVMSQDENGKKSISTVTGVETPIRDNMCTINFADGQKLDLTSEHPMFTTQGWKSINPDATLKEDPGIRVTALTLGDKIAKVDGSYDQILSISCRSEKVQTYNLLLDNGAHTYFAGGFLAHNKWFNITFSGFTGTDDSPTSGHVVSWDQPVHAWTCFPAGTKVLMDGGEQKNIEDVKSGDQVISQSESGNKSVSTVTALDQPVRDHMCQINFEDSDSLKLTNEHPLLTKTGWRAIAPKKEAYSDPNLLVSTLSKGDELVRSDGLTGTVKSISCWSETVQAYNLVLSGTSHTYFADGYLAHNKGGGPEGPGGCNLGSPTTFSVTHPDKISTHATATWTPVAGAVGEAIFVGTDKAAVESLDNPCPNGVGPGAGCVVANTNIPACTTGSCSYPTGDVLSKGTVYYWHLLVMYNGANCGQDIFSTDLTSCGVIQPSLPLRPGETATLTTDVNNSSEIGQVTYSTTASNVTISPNVVSRSNYPYKTAVTGISPTDDVKVNSYVKDNAGNIICTDWSDINVTPPPPWWQVGDSDVLSMGDLASNIPLLLPQKYFGLSGSYANGFPGVPAYSGNTNLNNLPSTNNVSTVGWLANTNIATPKVYDYAYFANQIPSDVQYNQISSADVAGSLESGGTHDANNYYWYKYDGSLSANHHLPLLIQRNIDLKDRKVILLVNDADLNIKGNINLNDGVGFFMAIVGKGPSGTKGNILVDPTVGNVDTGSGPNLEGIYLADNTFSDTSGNLRLHVRGSVVAYNGVYLYRNLGDAPNANDSSEFFEYAPDQIMLFPSKLGTRRINWKEVAP